VDQYIQLELSQDALDHAVASLSTTSVGDTARIMAVARAKSRCSDAAIKITRESIQMHGAIGFTDEYDAGLFLKRSLVLSAWLGNGYQHRRRYAELNLKETI
jgi:alkylation response protein AidB-like acyl-CoA dehydrogenase